MDTDEAALLAELRAISSKSAGASRFRDSDDGDLYIASEENVLMDTNNKQSSSKVIFGAHRTKDNEITKLATEANAKLRIMNETKSGNASSLSSETTLDHETTNIATAGYNGNSHRIPPNALQNNSLGIKSNLPNTFQGDRGGVAEDSELLAELRAISARSKSSDRFGEDEGKTMEGSLNFVSEPSSPSSPKAASINFSVPPWKRGARLNRKPTTLKAQPISNNDNTMKVSCDISENQSHARSQENGIRGGAAEDAELLALLKGISNESGQSRFTENGLHKETVLSEEPEPRPTAVADIDRKDRVETSRYGDDTTGQVSVDEGHQFFDVEAKFDQPEAGSPASSKRRENRPQPPWKRAPRKIASDTIVAATAPTFTNIRSEELCETNEERKSIINNTTSAITEKDSEESSVVPSAGNTFPLSSTLENNARSPPWRKKRTAKPSGVIENEVVTTSNKDMDEQRVPERQSLKNENQSTFTGERGGIAEDAELLALLRDVSSKSSSNRFNDPPITSALEKSTENMLTNDGTNDESTVPKSEMQAVVPPWKRASKTNKAKQSTTAAVVIQSPSKASNTNLIDTPSSVTLNNPSTFVGERGGTAEDAELLALLRGVSNRSAMTRFNDNDESRKRNLTSEPSHGTVPKQKESETVEIKDDKASAASYSRNESQQVLPNQGVPTVTVVEEVPSFGIKNDIPSSFKGERGGVAEDAELLALLRGVSANASANRSGDQSDVTIPKQKQSETFEIKDDKASASSYSQYRKESQQVLPNQGVATKAVLEEAPSFGIKNDIPSSFKGERGGVAEDAELLALLRGVSANTSANRFGDQSDVTIPKQKQSETVEIKGNNASASSYSQYRKESQQVLPNQGVATKAVCDEVPSFGIKNDTPSSFKGERGGAAEDAELLAILRGVSANASANRFADQSDPLSANDSNKPKKELSNSEKNGGGNDLGNGALSLSNMQTETEADNPLTENDLPTALQDKNWKVRSQAYSLLAKILVDQVQQSREPFSIIDSNAILDGLDGFVSSFVVDINAGALDKALEFTFLYVQYCRSAGKTEMAARITSSLLKKNAFTTRPKTTQLSNSICIKLMEVSENGAESLQAIVDVLLTEGLTSKNPKVVQAAASLIFDASNHFGSTSLPLASITTNSRKMLSHSNANVRDVTIKILAEICRALGSKAPVEEVIKDMKKAQIVELDSMLTAQPTPTPAQTGFRKQSVNTDVSADGALTALQAGTKELEAKRFAARPAVDLMAVLSKTDYSSRLSLSKWSEKVGALDTVIECGGEKPYKLADHSSSVNYAPLITDLKKLLDHTHFAVVSKAMAVLSMLAEGVGDKLYPHLRPLLTPLLQLTKDKKLTRSASACLDSFFGIILTFEHILDNDDGIVNALDEKKQKNALARTSALEFLGRCAERRDSAGPRGALTPQTASEIAKLCVHKLDDSDVSVRKASMNVLEAILNIQDDRIHKPLPSIIEGLKATNNRAFKSLSNVIATRASSSSEEMDLSSKSTASPTKNTLSQDINSSSVPPILTQDVNLSVSHTNRSVDATPSSSTEEVQIAIHIVEKLCIPSWSSPEDDGGIMAGLQSSKWILRQNALQSITSFIESGDIEETGQDVFLGLSSILLVIKEHTRGFKESNVNIMKSLMSSFIAVCEYHETKQRSFVGPMAVDAVDVAVQKISDRKLSSTSKALLSALCIVSSPASIVLIGIDCLKGIKSPVAHEEYLSWCHSLCLDFGTAAIGTKISDIVPWLLEEGGSSNAKVKRQAYSLIGLMNKHIGPPLKALFLSMAKQPSAKDELQKCFENHPFDASMKNTEWPKKSILTNSGKASEDDRENQQVMTFEIPKTDIISKLPRDITSRMGSNDGKTAWKTRKEALDEVDAALQDCSGLIDSSQAKAKSLVELMRALRDRLADTQINLKPVAARIIGSFLLLINEQDQAKLGKLVYNSLIKCVMNDIKKPMRDASLEALLNGTTRSSLSGGGINPAALEQLVIAFVDEVNEKSVRAGGLAELLDLMLSFADNLQCLDEPNASKGQGVGEKYATSLVECLTSSKSETRSAASSLLEASLSKNVIGIDTVKKMAARLKPADQRTVAPLISKLAKVVAPSSEGEKIENETVSVSKMAVSVAVVPRVHDNLVKPPLHDLAPQNRNISSAGSDVPSMTDALQNQHPLIIGHGKQGFKAYKSTSWPEFPEEPNALALDNLRKHWSCFLPGPSCSSLFPATGIAKQDDTKTGCELLSQAIEIDRTLELSAVVDQLDAIFKWISYALCCKETTTGLQDILALLKMLLMYLIDNGKELSDSDALVLVPLLFEKASVGKGRFRDVYIDILSTVQSDRLLSAKKLGSLVCVAVIEGSSQAKARMYACRSCIDCIEKIGLAGIGKKGVLVAARALSKETLVETRAASLDLMELILVKMNSDLQRLVKICGSNLNDKGRQLLEERVSRRDQKDNVPSLETPRRRSSLRVNADTSSVARREKETKTDLFDELPRLSLRNIGSSSKPIESPKYNALQDNISEDRFQFSKTLKQVEMPGAHQDTASLLQVNSFEESEYSAKTDAISVRTDGETSAAASLRARLIRIREKGKMPEFVNAVDSSHSRTDENEIRAKNVASGFSNAEESSRLSDAMYQTEISSLRHLMSKARPISPNDVDLLGCIDSVKKFHASLSRQTHSFVGLSSESLSLIRCKMIEHADSVVEELTRMICFSFDCGDSSITAGMSIPLLSVCLATLMALFRDNESATKVTAKSLILLIRETGTALLDVKLSASSELDETTASQMVRAINKLAVQAATGASRHVSILSLIKLQQKLCFGSTAEEQSRGFNSRLSRIVTKLFARVLKAEESLEDPYNVGNVDIDLLLRAMESFLQTCQQKEKQNVYDLQEQIEICKKMVTDFVCSFLETHQGNFSLKRRLVTLGFPQRSSLLESVISACEAEVDLASDYSSMQKGSPGSRHVADNEMSKDQRTNFSDGDNGKNMTVRIQSLRSRLSASELVVQTVVDDKGHGSFDESPRTKSMSSSVSSSGKQSKLSAPSPSRISLPSAGRPRVSPKPQSSSSQSLRDRLAASQETRKASSETSVISSSLSRAAALRARLEAVKHQGSSD